MLAMVAGLTIPNFSNTYTKFQLKSAAEDLAYSMRYAQTRSVMKNLIVRLEFEEDFSSYWLTQSTLDPQDQEDAEGQDFESIRGRMGGITKIPKDIKLVTEGPTIDFYPDGNIEKKTIELCHDQLCISLSTKDQRGYVRIYESKSS